MKRLRAVVGGLACLVIGVTGQLIVTRAIRTLFERQGSPFSPFAFDTQPLWRTAAALLHGQSPRGVLGVYGNWYPPPLEVLFWPLGLIPTQTLANLITVALCIGLMVAVLVAWSARYPLPTPPHKGEGESFRVTAAAWPAICSAPVADLVLQDQMTVAIWLAGASLALWAQWRRRWWLCGAGAMLTCIRPDSALPLLAVLVWVTMRQPRVLLKIAGGAALLLVPPTLVCFLWDPSWIADYAHSLALYPATGVFGLLRSLVGPVGPVLLIALVSGASLLVVRRNADRISLDRGAAVMALSLLAAPLEGMYGAAVILPAVVRLAQRPGLGLAPWVVAMAPWAVVVLLTPVLLGPDPALVVNLLPLTALWMLAAALVALLRPAAEPAHDEGRWRVLESLRRPIGLRRTSPPR